MAAAGQAGAMRLTTCLAVLSVALIACARSPRRRAPNLLDNEVRVPAVQLDGMDGPHYVVETRFRVVRSGRPRVLTAPKIGVQPGQLSQVTVLNQLSFVQDYDAEVSEGSWVVDPIIGILQDGVTLDLLVVPVEGDASSAWVGFDATAADLRTPIRKKTVRFTRGGAPGKVQLPKLDLGRSSGVRKVEIGSTLTLARLPAPDGSGRIELTASVTAVGDVTQVALPGVTAERAPAAPEPLSVDAERAWGLDTTDVDLRAMVAEAANATSGNAAVVLDFVMVDAALPSTLMTEQAARELIRRRARHFGRLELTSAAVSGARIASLLQTSYVQDYDVIVPDGHERDAPLPKGWPTVADPVIGTILSGRDARLERGEDGTTLHVRWAWPYTMPDFETDLGAGPTVTIELPELRLIDKNTELREGRWLLPIGKAIVTGHQGDEVQTAAVWIQYTQGT